MAVGSVRLCRGRAGVVWRLVRHTGSASTSRHTHMPLVVTITTGTTIDSSAHCLVAAVPSSLTLVPVVDCIVNK